MSAGFARVSASKAKAGCVRALHQNRLGPVFWFGRVSVNRKTKRSGATTRPETAGKTLPPFGNKGTAPATLRLTARKPAPP